MAAFTLNALTSEILTDPAAVGYGPFLSTSTAATAGNDGAIASLINLISSRWSVAVGNVAPRLLLEQTRSSELFALTVNQLLQYQLITGDVQINTASTNVQAIALGIFTSSQAPATFTNFVTAFTRNGSRAEFLWGTGTSISATQVANAQGRF